MGKRIKNIQEDAKYPLLLKVSYLENFFSLENTDEENYDI